MLVAQVDDREGMRLDRPPRAAAGIGRLVQHLEESAGEGAEVTGSHPLKRGTRAAEDVQYHRADPLCGEETLAEDS